MGNGFRSVSIVEVCSDVDQIVESHCCAFTKSVRPHGWPSDVQVIVIRQRRGSSAVHLSFSSNRTDYILFS